MTLQKLGQSARDPLLHLTAALNAIPWVGGTIATYFGEYRQMKMQERIDQFIRTFAGALREIEESKIDKDYLQSDEFAELFSKGMEQAAKSTSDEKLKRLANIMVNQALLDSDNRARTESVMVFLDRLSDLDLMVLLSFGRPNAPSLKATSRKRALLLVQATFDLLGLPRPQSAEVFDAIIYMDNLGLTWVSEKKSAGGQSKGKGSRVPDFSAFRSPLGDQLIRVCAPPDFFLPGKANRWSDWPCRIVNRRYHRPMSSLGSGRAND